MYLKVFTPSKTVLETDISKINFEEKSGFQTFLERHVDCVGALKQGVVTYTAQGKDYYIACDEGVIVKKGNAVSISTRLAILGNSVKELTQVIQEDFHKMEEERKEMSLAMARLELGLIKQLSNLNTREPNGL